MSDPLQNVEIEDVLSSIRRLVTEETKTVLRRSIAERQEMARQEMEQQPQQAATKLMLTPALRVTGDAASAPKPQDVGREPPLQLKPEFSTDYSDEIQFKSIARRRAEEAAKREASNREDEARIADFRRLHAAEETVRHVRPSEAPWRDPDATLLDVAAHAEDYEDEDWAEDDLAADELADAAEVASELSEDIFADAEAAQVAEDVLDETEELTAADPAEEAAKAEDAPDEAQPSTVEAILLAEEQAIEAEVIEPAAEVEEPGEDIVAVTEPDEIVEAPDEEPVAEAPAQPQEDQRGMTLGAKIKALEAAIAQRSDQWEPDGEGVDDYAGTPVRTMEWQDHDGSEKTRPAPADAPETVDTTVTEGKDDEAPAALDENLLDEDALRELVADIVRQELQGSLGERITRNVRKLVRREIHRALSVQELD